MPPCNSLTERPCQALIVGGGRRRGDMEQLAAKLGLTKRVHFLGVRKDIPDLLAAMDVFVLPSHSEGISLALLEAMAAGLPVIASNVGGLPEVVRHEENGLSVPWGTPPPWPRAWPGVFKDPAWAKTLGANARQHVRTHYSLTQMGQTLNAVYEELAEKKFGGGGQGS